MNKTQRQLVFDKCGGKCAYCGCELQKGWHIDHVEPVGRKTKTAHQHWRNTITGEKIEHHQFNLWRNKSEEERINWERVERKEVPDGFHYPERHVITNMLPACGSCNSNKRDSSIEGFRELIQGFVNSLNRYSTQYKFAKRYGLVQETEKPVVFYFETLTT